MGGRGLFAHTFTVLESAIDVNGHANNLEYLRWMQEVATAHSDACGWTLARYQETRTTWVIRSHAIDYLRPAFAGETLKLLTWIGGFEDQESPRHYLFWRERDRKVLARAKTVWVFIDTEAGRPRSIPESFRAAFDVVADEQEALRALRTGDI
ncbi:MAG: acyl-CoA thioesterase [Geothrix sp.]|jgi:acyl-CoA thioester hydrolase|uniref:Acyl-CoA thioesterase n=1 Tax=Candidatus Geothrix odensensis TaxID=2954440 RepID=A0A936K5D1_9BACT|nr:acyl-CoA thioesterase [Candidatus Geothrix odensensis]MCC6513336.1 acyl-CoA thioesterase [Geothrix sp.]